MLDMLQQSFRNAHNPGLQISVDEAMVRFKGRSSLKQYMPKKPIKRGFKIWCCSDASSGYLQEFQIYTGKEPALQNSEVGLTHAVVKHLLGPLTGKYIIIKTLYMRYFLRIFLVKTMLHTWITTLPAYLSLKILKKI